MKNTGVASVFVATGLLTLAVFVAGAILGEGVSRLFGVPLTLWWLATLRLQPKRRFLREGLARLLRGGRLP